MVADSFKIFGNHQLIQSNLALIRIGSNITNQCFPLLNKQLVYYIVILFYLLCQFQILTHISIYTACYHFHGCLRHFGQRLIAVRRHHIAHIQNFGNILCLIPNPFHIGNHFQRCGNLPQISCHRLLLQQQFQTKLLNVTLFLVNF